MKFENFFLRVLFGVCVLICGWTLAAMVTASPVSATVTASHTLAAAASGAPAHARVVG